MRRIAAALLLMLSLSLGAATVRGVWEKTPRSLGDEGSIVFDLGKIDGSYYIEGLPPKGGDYGVLKVTDIDTKPGERGNALARLKVIVFGVGDIKPATLQLKVLTEKEETVFEGVVDQISIRGKLNGSEPPPAMAGLVELPKPFPLMPWVLGISAFLAAVVIIILLLKKKPKRAAAREELTVERSPDDWLIGRLKIYVTKTLLSLQDYSDLSYDIRLYLEKKRELKALESTTLELSEILSIERPFRNLDVGEFVSIFTFCDFVKFARHFPDAGEEAKLKLLLREFIKEVETAMREEKRAA